MAEQVRRREKEKDKIEERQAKIKRMAELQKRLAELEAKEKEIQKDTSSALASMDSETAEANAQKLQEVESLIGDLANIEAILDKGFNNSTEISPSLPSKTLEQIELELAILEEEVAKEDQVKTRSVFEQLQAIKENAWIAQERYNFMYSIPPDPKSKDFSSWQDDWGRVLMDYARLAVLHIVYMTKLINEPPFSNFRERERAVRLIANYLVGKKLARWISKNQEELRVLWKSMEELASDVEKWAIENYGSQPIILQELKEANQVFSTLPEEDWEEIFKILKKRKKILIDKTKSGDIFIKFLV